MLINKSFILLLQCVLIGAAPLFKYGTDAGDNVINTKADFAQQGQKRYKHWTTDFNSFDFFGQEYDAIQVQIFN